jgi:uncharacterized membrane protein (TIGR02234 family)
VTRMTDRTTSKPVVLALVLGAALVILVSGSREWVSGSVDDAALGATVLHGKGSDVAAGALAAALVGLASAVAAATSGAVVRVVAACATLIAAVLGAILVVAVLADPGGALGRLAAAGTGRSGTLAAHGHVGVWAWVALAAMVVMGFGGLGALGGARRWHGLSSRYDVPVSRVVGEGSRRDTAGQPAAGNESAWDQLSRGEDPTAGQ